MFAGSETIQDSLHVLRGIEIGMEFVRSGVVCSSTMSKPAHSR